MEVATSLSYGVKLKRAISRLAALMNATHPTAARKSPWRRKGGRPLRHCQLDNCRSVLRSGAGHDITLFRLQVIVNLNSIMILGFKWHPRRHQEAAAGEVFLQSCPAVGWQDLGQPVRPPWLPNSHSWQTHQDVAHLVISLAVAST